MKHLLLLPSLLIMLGFTVSCEAQQSETNEAEAEEIVTADTETNEAALAERLHNIKQRVLTDPVDADTISVDHIEKTAEEWKAILTEAEYHILRERGTEPAFENKYYNNKTEGIYYCAACGLPLFSSKTKFHSGTGWPSYWAPIDTKLVERRVDTRFGMTRTEVVCAQCGSHLGHIFPNSTVPSGERHCLNSLALDFRAQEL